MDLTLTIIEAPQNVNMINHTKAFRTEGGSFGRADNNSWVLPDHDRIVSSRHAEISFKDGHFYLTDLSTNGTFHNQRDTAIGQDQAVPLAHGDILSVGDYRLKVSVKNPEASATLPKGLHPADFLDSSDKTTFTATMKAEHEQLHQIKELDDWLDPGITGAGDDRSSTWGTAGRQAHTFHAANAAFALPVGANDPLTALGVASDSPTPQSCIDPLAALDQANHILPQSVPLWADEEDWWKDGSDSDHAPAISQALQTPSLPLQPPHPVALTAQSATPGPSAITEFPEWDHQPHLQNIPATDVNDALGMSPVLSSVQPVSQPVVQPRREQPPQQPPQDMRHLQAVQQTLQSVQPSAPSPPSSWPAGNPAAPPQTTAGNIADLAAALGLANLSAEQLFQLPPEVAAIVNETVNRLIDLLRACSSIKNELRVQRTMIQMTDNNPLKFSVSAPDAIKTMFGSENPAFMRPSDAVKASFDDLSDHQVAVLAGMRSGYHTILKHFDPAALDKRFNNPNSLLSSKKARNWETFEQHYAMLQRDEETSYDVLFGSSFATTYEKQLAELKTARNLTRPRK